MFDFDTSAKLFKYSRILQKAHKEIRGIERDTTSYLTFKGKSSACDALAILSFIDSGMDLRSMAPMKDAADLFSKAMYSRNISPYVSGQREKLTKLITGLKDYLKGNSLQGEIPSLRKSLGEFAHIFSSYCSLYSNSEDTDDCPA